MSLFPFLDILACVIGNLILIITAVVLDQMDTKPIAEAAKIDDLREQTKQDVDRSELLQKQLLQLLAQADVKSQRIAAAGQKVLDAEKQAAAAQSRQQQAALPAKPSAIAATDQPLAREILRLKDERKKSDAQASQLAVQIAERKKPAEQSIVVLPPGTGGGPTRSLFIEASHGKLIVHEGTKSWELPADKATTDPRLKAVFEKVKADKEAIVTFLVRGDGLGALAAGQRAAEEAGVRSGRVPLPGDGSLDLSNAR